jgi:hypothetical protein
MAFTHIPSLRRFGYGLIGWSALTLACTSAAEEGSEGNVANISGHTVGFMERIGDLFTDHITDCQELKEWCVDHPEALTARSIGPGLELRLRQMNSLVSVCQEGDWSGDLADPTAVTQLLERRRTSQFLLEARYATNTRQTEATSWLDSLRTGDHAASWILVQDGDSAACLMAIPEATGGLVPGLNLLLAFDAEERPGDYEVIYTGHGTLRVHVRFAFEGSELRRLNEALPSALRYTTNPRKV